MRPGQQNKRGRGRSGSSSNGNANRKGQNPLSRSYDSSGPDVKIRGTAQHVAEKYMNLARDAQSSGDRVMAENYLQHAEHYNRIIAAAQLQMQERFQRDDRDVQGRDGDESDSDGEEGQDTAQESQGGGDRRGQQGRERGPRPVHAADSPQPVIEGTPAEMVAAQESAGEQGALRQSARRRGRPKRPRAEDGGASADEVGPDSPEDSPAIEAASAD